MARKPKSKQRPGYRRPRAGEPRRKPQPFNIGYLPEAVRNQILKLKFDQGYSAEEIEELSQEFVRWDTLPPRVRAKFKARRISKTSIYRWLDVEVKQLRRRVQERAAASAEMVGIWQRAGFKNVAQAARNQLADIAFRLSGEEDEAKRQKLLLELGWLSAGIAKSEVAQKKLALEKQQVELAQQRIDLQRRLAEKVKGLREGVAKKKLTQQELDRGLEELYGLAQQN